MSQSMKVIIKTIKLMRITIKANNGLHYTSFVEIVDL